MPNVLKVLLGFAVLSVAALVSASAPAQVQEEAFPARPLRFIVPYPPGGPLDTAARWLSERLAQSLGQAVVVENRSGAGGNIGAAIVAKARPDGHSLLMGAVAINAVNPWLYSSLPFDPERDFAPVALVASVPNVLILNRDFAMTNGIRSVRDFIDYAEDHPGELNFASGGNGSAGHLAGELFNVRAGINTLHIPYQGAAPAKLALLSGEVDFMFDNLASAAPLIDQEKVVALAVSTAERSALLPGLPTLEQEGVGKFDIGTWFGVFTTAGTPDAVVSRLNRLVNEALAEPQAREMLRGMGSDSTPGSPEDFSRLVRRDLSRYREIVELSNARLN